MERHAGNHVGRCLDGILVEVAKRLRGDNAIDMSMCVRDYGSVVDGPIEMRLLILTTVRVL
jgi:hypothetical protein